MLKVIVAAVALWLSVSTATVTTREYLTANRDLYIGNAGSDANDCLTTATLCQHWQRIADLAYGSYDLGTGWNVTAHVVGSSQVFAESVNIPGAQVGAGVIKFVGNPSNPADVVWGVPTPGTSTINLSKGAALVMDGFQLQAGPGSNSVSVTRYATLDLSNFIMNVGPMHFDVSFYGIINTSGTCKITGGGNAFAHMHDNGYLSMFNSSCDVVGSWTYADYFLGCSENSVGRLPNMVFNVTGAITGRKALIHQGCAVGANLGFGVGTAGANAFFPGLAGSAVISANGIFNDVFGP